MSKSRAFMDFYERNHGVSTIEDAFEAGYQRAIENGEPDERISELLEVAMRLMVSRLNSDRGDLADKQKFAEFWVDQASEIIAEVDRVSNPMQFPKNWTCPACYCVWPGNPGVCKTCNHDSTGN